VTPLFLRLSEIIRLNGEQLPLDFSQRIGTFEREFEIDGAVLHDLLAFKREPRSLSDSEISNWHKQLFPVLDAAVAWIERNWQPSRPVQ
jgi:hypothetical protein